MELVFVYIGLQLAGFGITIITALQCPSCTYFMANKSMHGAVRNIAGEIFEQFKDSSCSKITDQTIINVEECLDISGKISRCSFMKGLVELTIPLTLLRDVDVKLQVFHRGCYYSTQAEFPPYGCRKRKSNSHEATFINHIVNKEMSSSEPYKVSEFDGEVCICSDMHCSSASAASSISLKFPFQYRDLFHIMVIHWMLRYISASLL